MIDRETAWGILTEHVEDRGLRRHMQAVEAAMRRYAGLLDEDADRWGMAGLLHDFDWEIHPTTEQHPKDGAPILRERGVPEDVVQAILAHNPEGSGVDADEAHGLGPQGLRRDHRPDHRRLPGAAAQGRPPGEGQVGEAQLEGQALLRRGRPRRDHRETPRTSRSTASTASWSSGSTSATCSRP